MAYTNKQRIMDYRSLFGTDEGKRVFADLCSAHFIFEGTFPGEALDMAHAEGQRFTMLRIIKILEMKPADLPAIRTSMAEQFGINQEA